MHVIDEMNQSVELFDTQQQAKREIEREREKQTNIFQRTQEPTRSVQFGFSCLQQVSFIQIRVVFISLLWWTAKNNMSCTITVGVQAI